MAERPARLNLPRLEFLSYSQEDSAIKMTRETSYKWAKDVMPPYVKSARLNFHQHMASKGKMPLNFPHEFMTRAAEQGLLGMVIPAEYGGQEFSPLQQVAAIEALAAVDAGLALKVLVQNTLTAYPILKHGTQTQKEKYLGPMARGELIGAFALSEPDYGSDAMNLQCKAEKVEGGWKINGRKIWSTSANAAGIMVLAARTGTPESGRDGMSTFIAPLDHNSKQLEIKTIAKHGQHGSQFCEVKFEDYFIPEDALLGEVNKGKDVLRDTLNLSRFWIAAQGTGAAIHGYEEGLKYAQGREMYGQKQADLPLMARNLDHMKREIDIARLLVRKAALSYEKGDKYAHVWSSLAKLIAGEVAFQTTHDAELICGAMGYTMEMEPGYIATDAEVIRIYEGAREVQVDLLLKYLTEEQIDLTWPIADHPVKPIEEMLTVDEVMAEIEGWIIDRRKIDLEQKRGLYFEEIPEENMIIKHDQTYRLTMADQLAYARLTKNPARIHLDEKIANGTHMEGVVMGLTVDDLTQGTILGNIEVKTIIKEPIYVGDRIRVESTFGQRKLSRSKPYMGVATLIHRGFRNDETEPVIVVERTVAFKRAPNKTG